MLIFAFTCWSHGTSIIISLCDLGLIKDVSLGDGFFEILTVKVKIFQSSLHFLKVTILRSTPLGEAHEILKKDLF